ncbi:hypothetical protein DPMN_061580 [Dreissena polymorpha]|uniref:Uncharacterized protein n=1 Tax=Dreissena polymorpha TaxID=45954 RepID=A0A9D4HIK5_DREPO|nr:hypothetical protein DPMN_061580 [Dreissena polymorpha]
MTHIHKTNCTQIVVEVVVVVLVYVLLLVLLLVVIALLVGEYMISLYFEITFALLGFKFMSTTAYRRTNGLIVGRKEELTKRPTNINRQTAERTAGITDGYIDRRTNESHGLTARQDRQSNKHYYPCSAYRRTNGLIVGRKEELTKQTR